MKHRRNQLAGDAPSPTAASKAGSGVQRAARWHHRAAPSRQRLPRGGKSPLPQKEISSAVCVARFIKMRLLRISIAYGNGRAPPRR